MSATYNRVSAQVLGSRRRCLTRMRDAEWRNTQAVAKTMFDTATMLFNAAFKRMGDK